MDLQCGDIFASKGTGIPGWAVRALLSPYTNRFHFGFLWLKRPDGDFITLESKHPKGLQPGRLSWYNLNELEFYRVNCPLHLRKQAPFGAIDFSPAMYDHLLILKFLLGGLLAFFKIIVKEHRIRRLLAEDFPYVENSSPICTEVVDIGCDSVGVNVIPIGVAPLPNAFKQAEIEGRMTRITE